MEDSGRKTLLRAGGKNTRYEEQHISAELKQSKNFSKKLQKRNDELAAENCKLRGLICKLHDLAEIAVLGPLLSDFELETLNKAIKDQKIHRGHDKKREIKAISKSMNELQSRAIQIKELGGHPGEQLLAEIKKHQEKLASVKKSDPMNTDLY